MSYQAPRFLTLFAILVVAGALGAQDRQFMRQVDRLASPVASERATAIGYIAGLPGDIGSDLRVAYRLSDSMERAGLIQVAMVRRDDALATLAAEALTSDNERLRLAARAYFLTLPPELLRVDERELSAAAKVAWNSMHTLRLRRDTFAVLLDAWLKPGNFTGQFDLMRRGKRNVDAELLSLMRIEEGLDEALELAAQERIEQGVEPNRMFSVPWRNLNEGFPGLTAAMAHLRRPDAVEMPDHLSHAAKLASLSVMTGLRVLAVRALAHASPDESALREMEDRYHDLHNVTLNPTYSAAVDIDALRTEIEVLLARHGEPRFLDARIMEMRGRIERIQRSHEEVMDQRPGNRPQTRTDLVTQSEIALLMMRAGAYAEAEKELRDTAQLIEEQLPGTMQRGRVSLSSLLAVVYYNLACAQAKQLKVSDALENLQKAVANGYNDFGWMLEDGDLHHVRNTPAFQSWLARVAPPAVLDPMRDADAQRAAGE